MKDSKGQLVLDTLRLWTIQEAQAAVPYFCSVARSLRDHYLEILAKRREVQLFTERLRRDGRKALIEGQEARLDLENAEQAYQDTLEELRELNAQSLDPVQGTALLPFLHDGQLAWYVFDLFSSQPICSWRSDYDPIETRRALTAPPVN